MSRARILADYVAGGVTAAEFDRLDGIGSAAVGISDSQTLTNKTLTSPTLTTPAFTGTPTGLNGITSHHDMWALSATNYGRKNPIVDWSRGVETLGWGRINGAEPMTLDTGIFSFPTEGYWRVFYHAWCRVGSTRPDPRIFETIYVTLNGSAGTPTFNDVAQGVGALAGDVYDVSIDVEAIIDVTDKDEVKVKLAHYPDDATADSTGVAILYNSTAYPLTYCSFTKLGDT